jgi:hypothetical protein
MKNLLKFFGEEHSVKKMVVENGGEKRTKEVIAYSPYLKRKFELNGLFMNRRRNLFPPVLKYTMNVESLIVLSHLIFKRFHERKTFGARLNMVFFAGREMEEQI